MRKRLLRLLTILTLLAAAFSITVWAVSLVHQHRDSQRSQVADSIKRKTLREIGQERDIEVEVPDGELHVEYDNVRSLAKDAEAVLIGRITEEKTFFDGDEYIMTSYLVDVQRVLKDTKLNAPLMAGQEPPAPLVTPLKIVRRGGVMSVNGHRVSEKLKGSELLKANQDYVFFLWWSTASNAYILAGDASGVFLIQNDLHIKPLGLNKGLLRHNGTSLETFVEEVLATQ